MFRSLPLLVAGLCLAAAAQAVYAWPPRVVTVEEMTLIAPIRIAVPVSRQQGEVRRPVVVQLHVDKTGTVQHVLLVDSCGSSGHDEAAMRAMHDVRFKPKEIDGVAEEVTLVMPLHLPLTGPQTRF